MGRMAHGPFQLASCQDNVRFRLIVNVIQ
jgi:hypothetical protein